MRRVIVHIDSLVLKGFRHEDRRAVAKGLQEQLTHVLSEPGAAEQLQQAGSVSRLQVGNLNLSLNAKPAEVGIATANGIGKRLGL